MSKLSIASWGLLIGATGQMGFYGRLFPSSLAWLVWVVLLLPWLTVFTVSFCKQPPFGPRAFRYCLVFAMGLYVVITLLAETLYLIIHPAPSGHFPLIVARILMYLSAFSFIVFVRACIVLRRCETQSDA